MRFAKYLHCTTKSDNCRDHAAAAIDVGTNTIRLLIASVHEGRLERLKSAREVTRLGSTLSTGGKLNSHNIDISIRSLVSLKAICDKYKIDHIAAVGTSALREAIDSDVFLKLAREKAGIDIKVISGEKEADLTIRGILCNRTANPANSIVTDIGGGSTELILGNNGLKFSLPLGAVSLLEQFIGHDPPSHYELSHLVEHSKVILGAAIVAIKKQVDSTCVDLIATGGTPTTLAAIHLGTNAYDGEKIHGIRLPYSAIRKILDSIIALPLENRSSIVGLESSRADIIIPGTLILMSIMDMLGNHEVTVSDYGLLEGIIHEELCIA